MFVKPNSLRSSMVFMFGQDGHGVFFGASSGCRRRFTTNTHTHIIHITIMISREIIHETRFHDSVGSRMHVSVPQQQHTERHLSTHIRWSSNSWATQTTQCRTWKRVWLPTATSCPNDEQWDAFFGPEIPGASNVIALRDAHSPHRVSPIATNDVRRDDFGRKPVCAARDLMNFFILYWLLQALARQQGIFPSNTHTKTHTH